MCRPVTVHAFAQAAPIWPLGFYLSHRNYYAYFLRAQTPSTTHGVTLHAPWIGRGFEHDALRGPLGGAGREPALRPILAELHAMAAPAQFRRRRRRETPLQHDESGLRL